MVLRRAIGYIILILLFASPVYAIGERVLAWDEDGLNVLNEELRQLRDRTFQIKSSSSDTTPGYLDGGILDITVIGDVTDGEVAGWAISATSLTSGTGATTVGLDSGGTNPAIYCGSATPASAPFRVTGAGAVTATSGSIGGWTLGASTISSTNLTIDSGNELIKSNDYVSGALGKGWQIDADQAEFNNIRARGKITTSNFEYDTISSVGGSVLISHDSDILGSDMGADDTDTALVTSGDVTFATGDFLRLKDGTSDEWLEVSTVTDASNYVVIRDKDSQYADGSNPEWTTGTCVVNYGQNLDGGILMTASDTNSPHLDVYTIDATPWDSGITTRLRLGNLNGFLGETNDLYGIAIGETTKYLKYDPTNGLRIKGIVLIEAGSEIEGLDATNVAGWAHVTDATKIDGGDIYTGTVTADKITAGTYVGGDFVIGDGGAFKTDNYVADTTGVMLDHTGLEINQGATIQGEGVLETIMIYSMLFGGD